MNNILNSEKFIIEMNKAFEELILFGRRFDHNGECLECGAWPSACKCKVV